MTMKRYLCFWLNLDRVAPSHRRSPSYERSPPPRSRDHEVIILQRALYLNAIIEKVLWDDLITSKLIINKYLRLLFFTIIKWSVFHSEQSIRIRTTDTLIWQVPILTRSHGFNNNFASNRYVSEWNTQKLIWRGFCLWIKIHYESLSNVMEIRNSLA